MSFKVKSAVAALAPLLVHAGISVCLYESGDPVVSVPLHGFISDVCVCVCYRTLPHVLRLHAQRFLRSDSSHAVRNDSRLLDDGNSAKPPCNRLKWLIFAGQTVLMWSLACGAVELDWTVTWKIVKSLEMLYSDSAAVAAVAFARDVKRFPSAWSNFVHNDTAVSMLLSLVLGNYFIIFAMGN